MSQMANVVRFTVPEGARAVVLGQLDSLLNPRHGNGVGSPCWLPECTFELTDEFKNVLEDIWNQLS